MKKQRKRFSYQYFFHIMGILFAILLLFFMIFSLVKPDRSFSEKENRVLSSRPGFDLSQIASGNYETQYETYVNDQFPLRDLWVTIKAATDRVLGKTDGNGVYLGKSGYLMEDFTPPSKEQLDRTLNAMTTFASDHPDLKQYVLIAPNAVNILKDKLPASAPVKDQNQYLDTVRDAVTAQGVTFIDVRDTLTSHKDDGIYYHTDHHWTTQGAYFAFLQAAGAMDLDSASIPYDKLPVTTHFQGTLSAKSGFRSNETDEIDVFLPRNEDTPASVVNYVSQQKKSASFYSTEQLDTRDKYAMFFGGNFPQIKISTATESERTLLVLKDSYANCFVPFLAPYYRTIIMVDPRYYYGDLEELMEVENIQEVLYLYNANTFFSDTSLELDLKPQQGA